MFSNTLSFLSSLNVSDQASHPYKTTIILALKNLMTVEDEVCNWSVIKQNMTLLKVSDQLQDWRTGMADMT